MTLTKTQQLYIKQLNYLCEDIDDVVSLLANTSAFLNQILEDVNWVGFYVVKNNFLQLSAFQGKPACIKIAKGNGVCGYSYATSTIQRIKNVHEFSGHIACDSATNSEIVVPIILDNQVFGVLDIDSISYDRFQLSDEIFLQSCVDVIASQLNVILNQQHI